MLSVQWDSRASTCSCSVWRAVGIYIQPGRHPNHGQGKVRNLKPKLLFSVNRHIPTQALGQGSCRSESELVLCS